MSRNLKHPCVDCGTPCKRKGGRCRPCDVRFRRGENATTWRGGKTVTSHGYVMVMAPDHPHAHVNGYVYEHRLVAEATLGRILEPGEAVHHKNGDKGDNRPENLEVLRHGEHSSRHWRERGSLSDDQIRELVQAGVPAGVIAAQYRVGTHRVARARREMAA